MINEALTLLARLENDRQETENALKKEKERVVILGAKIDALCQKRIKEFPIVIQKGKIIIILAFEISFRWLVS